VTRSTRRKTALVVFSFLACLSCGGGGSSSAGTKPGATPAPIASAPTPTPAGGPWTLVFADEFDTPGSLDPAKWGYEIGSIRNNELQYYTSRSENVRLEGGNLVIEGRKEAYQGYGYTSASVNTKKRFEFQYGKVEVRAKIPSGVGTWPAIWMLGANIDQVGWPSCGEVDIMENVGFDPLKIYGTIHTLAGSGGNGKGSNVTLANPWEDFHVYAIEWYADRIDFFVDGQKYFTYANDGSSRAWPFDKPQYLLLNLALGGAWGGQKGMDDSAFPHRYLIDYVRIYKRG
jgi:beta-glucanase (GH16 family)